MSIEYAVEVSVAGAVDGKYLRGMLHIMEAAPGEDMLRRLVSAIALTPHDMAISAVQAKNFACIVSVTIITDHLQQRNYQ